MRRVLTLATLLVVGACGGGGDKEASPTTAAVVTTTTVAPEVAAAQEKAADVVLIKQLWRGFSDVWTQGADGGFTYLESHNYPGLGYSADQCKRFIADGGRVPKGYTQEHIVNEATIERDDGWRLPDTPLKGQELPGRIYIMQVTATASDANRPVAGPNTQEVHVVIRDGQAYFFQICA